MAPCCKSSGFVARLPSRPEQKSRTGFGQEQAVNCNCLASQRGFTSTFPIATESNSIASFRGKRKTKPFQHSFTVCSLLATLSLLWPERQGSVLLFCYHHGIVQEGETGLVGTCFARLWVKKLNNTCLGGNQKITTGKGGKPWVLPTLFALSGRSDPLQMSWPLWYPADTCFTGKLNSYAHVILKTRSPTSMGRWAKPPNRLQPSFLIHWVKANKNFCSGVLNCSSSSHPLTVEDQLQNKHKYKQVPFILDGYYLKIGRIQALYRCLLAVILVLRNNFRLCCSEILFNTFSASRNRQCFIFPA